ncbi:MAG: hypothetical protein SCH70_07790 [Candidatus Methanoperedens sp.]|nr:hypothetical protein [Candidatus Methanoperedens sp.]
MRPNQIRTLLRQLADQREFITSNLDKLKGRSKEVQAKLKHIDSQTAQLEADLTKAEKTKPLTTPPVPAKTVPDKTVPAKTVKPAAKTDKYTEPKFTPGSVSELSWKLDKLLAKKQLTPAEKAEAQRLAKEIFEKRGETLLKEQPPPLSARTEPAGTKKAVDILYPREEVLKEVYKKPYSKTTHQIDVLKLKIWDLEKQKATAYARMQELRSYETKTPEHAARKAELLKKTSRQFSALDDTISTKKDELYQTGVREFKQSDTLSQYYEKVYAEAYVSPAERSALLRPDEFNRLTLREKMREVDKIQKEGIQLKLTGEFDIKKGIFSQSYYTKRVTPAKYERTLVKEILSKPGKKQAYLDTLTPEQQQWIQKRGGIDRITEREKARMLNEIFFEEGGKRSEKSMLYLKEQWEKQATGSDINYVKHLFGSMHEAQKLAETQGAHRTVMFYEYEPIRKLLARPEELSKAIIPRDKAKFENDKLIIDWSTFKIDHNTRTINYRTTDPSHEPRSIGFVPQKTAEPFEKTPLKGSQLPPSHKYTSERTSIEGIVTDILPSKGKVQQYAVIKDKSGAEIRVTTFTDDIAPLLEVGKEYRLENVFLQPYTIDKAGKRVYYGINVKPSAGSRIIPSKPLPEISSTRKPLKTFYQRPVDPVTSTAIEGGKLIFITRSGKRLSREGYLEKNKLRILEEKKKTRTVLTEEDALKMEKEAAQQALVNEQMDLMAIGVLPFGLLGLGTGPGTESFRDRILQQQQSRQQRPKIQPIEELRAKLETPEELGKIWYGELTDTYQGAKERDIEWQEKRDAGTLPAYREYLPVDLGITALEGLGSALYPLQYPQQALSGRHKGVGAMEGIRQKIYPSEALGIEDPLQGLAADILLDPVNLVIGAGAIREGIQYAPKLPAMARKQIPYIKAMLADQSATIGTRKSITYTKHYQKLYIEKLAKQHGRTPEVQELLMKGEAKLLPDGTIQPLTAGAQKIMGIGPLDDWFKYRYQFQIPKTQPVTPPSPSLPGTIPTPAQVISRTSAPAQKTAQFITRETYVEEFVKKHGIAPEIQKLLINGEARIRPDSTIQPLTARAQQIITSPAAKLQTAPIPPASASSRTPVPVQTPKTQPIQQPPTSSLDDWFKYRYQFQTPKTAQVTKTSPLDDWFKYRYQFQVPKTQPVKPSPVQQIAKKLIYTGTGATIASIAAGYLAGELTPETRKRTAMGDVPEQTFFERRIAQPEFFREDEGRFWKALHLLSIDTYAQGGLVETAKSAIDKERDFGFYGYQHRIPLSQALGIADPEQLSWRTIPALAVDIAASPITYASFGAADAAKITLRTGQTAALNAKGVKTLKGLTQAEGAAGEARFLDDLATSPAAQKEYLAFEGIGLRGWGPFFKGKEMELVSPQKLQALKGIVTRAMPETVTSAKIALKITEAARKTKEAAYRRVVPFYDVKKLPRPETLKAEQMEFADAFLHYQKSMQWETGKYLKMSKELSKEAKEAFGPEYKTLVRDHIETPVIRGTAGLTKAQGDILNTIDALHKSMAEEEMARGLLSYEIGGYLRHALTPDARKFIEAGGKTKAGFALEREYKGPITSINKRFREESGVDFDLFVDDPFVALAVRGEEHARAVKTNDFMEQIRIIYGKGKLTKADSKLAPPEGYELTQIPELKGVWVPTDIARIIDPAYKEASGIAKGYDKAMKVWKWQQTAIHPAYHVLNVIGGIFNAMVLGGTKPDSFIEGSKLVKQFRTGVPSAETYTTPAGKTYTANELIELAGEHGVLGSPGFMDIARTATEDIALMQKTGKLADLERFVRSVDPSKMARLEEDWMRTAMFFDRVVNKGEAPWTAARYTEKFLFEYHPAGKTEWTKEVAQRAFPFWTFYWNNLLLQMRTMATQPGKYGAFGKTADAMAEGQELQPWMAGQLLAPAGDDKQLWTYQTPITSLQMFEKLGGFGRLAGMGQPTLLSQVLASTAPLAKIPVELATGRNIFSGQEYRGTEFMGAPVSPELETIFANIIGRPIHAKRMAADAAGLDEREPTPYDVLTGAQRATPGDLTAADKLIGWLGGARKYWTQSAIKEEQELKQEFFESRQRPDSFTWQQMYEVWKAEGQASAYSGIPEQLQPGHILGAAEGGSAETWNLIIQTAEENYEWMSAQVMRQRLPEQAWKQEGKWEQLDIKFEQRAEERTAAMGERLAAKGKELNEAIIEKIEYDTRKAKNVQLLNERLTKVRSFLNKLRTKLFRELELLEKKKGKGFDDVHSRLQVQLIRRMIPEYEKKYALIAGLAAEERAKEFGLPEQIIQAEGYTKALFDQNFKVARKGSGPELLDETYIKGLVTDEDISRDWSIIQMEAVIVGFPSYIPEEVRAAKQLPIGEEWEQRQKEAKERLTSLLGTEIYDFEAARTAGLGAMPGLLVPAEEYTDVMAPEEWIGIDKGGLTGTVSEHEKPSWLAALGTKLLGWKGIGTRVQKPGKLPAEIPAEYGADIDRDIEKDKRYWEIHEVLEEMLESDMFYGKIQTIAVDTFNRGAGVEI